MNVMQQGVIALLKSAVTGEAVPLPEGFDLGQACSQLYRHYMESLLYEGAMRCGIPRNSEVMRQLLQWYCLELRRSEGQLRDVRRIFASFDKQGIDYLPLKGCNMKPRYPKPELRHMSDADVLIRLEQRPQIEQILEELGFSFLKETDHELVWRSSHLELELHKHLIPSNNKDLHPYFGTGWQLARHRNLGRHEMTPEKEFLFQVTHFAKHFRDGGVGCRYVVDLWVFLRSFPDLDTAQVEAELEQLRLLEFYRNIRQLIDCWFEGGQTSEKMDFLTDFIFSSGSWGNRESRAQSHTVIARQHSPLGFSGRLLYIWQTIFQPLNVLEGKYTVLKKAPWMLPVVWLIRPFYKLIFEFRSLKNQQQNLQALSPESLDEREKMLRYVGLEYRF